MIYNLLFKNDPSGRSNTYSYTTERDFQKEIVFPVYQNVEMDRENPWLEAPEDDAGNKQNVPPESRIEKYGVLVVHLPQGISRGYSIDITLTSDEESIIVEAWDPQTDSSLDSNIEAVK
jgi:hypothetical protein